MSNEPGTSEQRLSDLLARDEIYQLVCTYMRGQDRLDAATHRSVFWDDAELDYGFYIGGPDGFVEFAQSALRNYDSCHHMIGQVQIDVDGDVAYGEVYYNAFHQGTDADGTRKNRVIAGRYIDRYEKREGAWQIAYRTELSDWADERPAADDFFTDNPMPRGDRWPNDRLYTHGKR